MGQSWVPGGPERGCRGFCVSGALAFAIALHDLEQFLQRSAEPIEPNHGQCVARPDVVEQLGQAGPLEGLARDHVREDAERARRVKALFLAGGQDQNPVKKRGGFAM